MTHAQKSDQPPYARSRDGRSGWVDDEQRDFSRMVNLIALSVAALLACGVASILALTYHPPT